MKKTPLNKGTKTLKKTELKKGTSSLKKGTGLKSNNIPLKKGTALKKVNKTEEKLAEEKELRAMRTKFFEQCWEQLSRRSEVSPAFQFRELNRAHYHHVFPKAKYPEIEFCFDVILCVTFEEHQILERDLEAFEEAAQRRKWVLNNWEYCVEQSNKWKENFKKATDGKL